MQSYSPIFPPPPLSFSFLLLLNLQDGVEEFKEDSGGNHEEDEDAEDEDFESAVDVLLPDTLPSIVTDMDAFRTHSMNVD